jgi:ribosomal protein L7/L12
MDVNTRPKALRLAMLCVALLGSLLLSACGPTFEPESLANRSAALAPDACIVPNLAARDQSDAETVLEAIGLKVVWELEYSDTVAAGLVISQTPVSGSRLDPCGGEVALVVSLGPPAASEAAEEEEAGQTESDQEARYDVVLVDMGPRKAYVVKVCQAFKEPEGRRGGVGCPSVILAGATEEDALDAEARLEAEGATVRLEEPGYVPPEPEPDIEGPFLLLIEDVFTIRGEGPAVSGRVERGVVQPRDTVEIVGLGDTRQTIVTGLETSGGELGSAQAGEIVGVVLRGIARDEVQRGMVLAEPGSIGAHVAFQGYVYLLTQDEGGRHTPFSDGHHLRFVFPMLDVEGVARLPRGVEAAAPGDVVRLTVVLAEPVALEEGQPFAMREGGLTVGTGWIDQLLEAGGFDVGPNSVKVIQVVRAVTGLGLREAKALVEAAPGTVLERVPEEEAEGAKAHLEDAGAMVVVVPSAYESAAARYDVVLIDMGPRKAYVVKVCQALKEPEGRRGSVGCPVVILAGATEEDALDAQARLEAEGATVRLEEPGYVPPEPEPDIEGPFLLPIEDVFTIRGEGTAVSGRVERGVVQPGDSVEIVGLDDTRQTIVTGLETSGGELGSAQAGEIVGVVLRGIARDEVQRGMVLAEPGSIGAHAAFQGYVYLLTQDEGGRHAPFSDGHHLRFVFPMLDVEGVVRLPGGVEAAAPGDVVRLTVVLAEPVALEEGQPFAMREGGLTVGTGSIDQFLEAGGFDVVLTDVGPNSVKVIQVVRAVTGLGLREAKALVEAAPSTVLERVSEGEAEGAKAHLEDAGATVVVVPSASVP